MIRFPLYAVIIILFMFYTTPGGTMEKPYEWQAGSVFKEYTYFGPDVPGHNHSWPVKIEEVDPFAPFEFREKPEDMPGRRSRARKLRELDIEKGDATAAELLVELTNCHIATPGWFAYNRDFPQGVHEREKEGWIPLPRTLGTPGPDELYHQTVLGSRAVSLDISRLKEGKNTFQFTAGPQMKFSWGFGCLWVYDFTVRVYHPRKTEHPSVAITNIITGAEIGENPQITVKAQAGKAPVKRIDVFAFYDGFNETGSGLTREWHGQLRYGVPTMHVGSIDGAAGTLTWNTEWVPDQEQSVRLVARAVDEDGWNTVSAIVEDLRFRRTGRRVRHYAASNIPERFSVRNNTEKQCDLVIDTLEGTPARACIMVNTSFGGEILDAVRLNGTKIGAHCGRQNRYGTDTLDVPVDVIKQGVNIFSAFGLPSKHGPEFDWPGPALLVEYKK